ncbi:hypothetical protein OS493_039786 [Desmophyllum pertusum]|uniref:Uncharacterized protein n=1 Tax=Desmophyllum pertusum TaxID=174260 RepID=A0A9X0CHE9_9CNID|nr:hypothetical protein OS493_039786 [Desmophyllum pertusum]
MLNYDFQSCPRIKKESLKDLDVGDIEFIRIALIGLPQVLGKTSFVGTLQRAIGEAQNAFEAGNQEKKAPFTIEEY